MSSLFASIKAALLGDDAAAPHASVQAATASIGTSGIVSGGHAARRHSPSTVEELELELLLEALFQCHGYDFRGYERAVVERKVQALQASLGLPTISALQSRVLHDEATYNALLRALYVTPALMFDNAAEVSMLRLSLGICLHGAALPRVWLADCAGVQQAWTLAILLEQEQLATRTEIHATVASDAMLAEVRQASLPMDRLGELQGNYIRSGGVGKLIDYFDVSEDGTRAVLKSHLSNRITWSQYNLVTDASFNEFQMILGHRALPDFGPSLRKRVLQLFHDSLAPFGMLALDRPLDQHDPLARDYKAILAHQPWYKRVA
ncbi:chemotaxis protein methyltransferase CheR [Duganella sacchari]|uniref:Chemotaxis protein methyltransferase CheR n=1 Tax=Duganella sacchari TaxID=551987 RepID=A0A1M7NZS2_9BURK|nr:CheR family methyltransferase [Duganella sacchari]SHN09642.1 chemotaxis protein methyltransferase CheR [Duganella sacchari]